MGDMGEQHDGVARVLACQQLRAVVEAGEHGHVGVVAFQVGQHLLRVAHADGQLHARVPCAVGGHHFDHMEGPHGADLELALVQLPRVAQEELGLGLQRHDFLRHGQQSGACARERHAVAAAVEQLDLALALQRGDLGGDGGLAHAQCAGGGAEAAVVGDGDEGAVAGVAHESRYLKVLSMDAVKTDSETFTWQKYVAPSIQPSPPAWRFGRRFTDPPICRCA